MRTNKPDVASVCRALIAAAGVFQTVGLFAGTYTVTAPEEAKPHERTAAEELTRYLSKRVSDDVRVEGKTGVVFHVGDTALARREKLLSTQLLSEQWVIRSLGNEVLLNGGGPRGALFAVYHFLEDECGIRWWSEFEEDIPSPGPLDLPALNRQGKPAFAFRDIYRAEQGSGSTRTERRVRLNAHGDAAFGGAFTFGPPNFCHTFDHYLPAEEHLEKHPEWFSLRDGKRVGGQYKGQLCLTNPEVKDEILKRLTAFIERGYAEARKAGVEAPRIYDISHNDNQAYCTCERCKAAVEQYGLSGVNLNFVNALANAIAGKYPDVLLCTWAYQYTQDPPKGGVRAADNVIVRLCDTDSNQTASILEPDNRPYHDRVVAWSKLTKHLFIWDYAITFSAGLTGLPFPSEFHYGDLFRHYRDNHVSGIFWEHEHPHLADMWELKFFLETRLMENPDLDCRQLIERFMREYYGPAGASILAYREYLDKIRREKKTFISWFPQLSAFNYIADEDIAVCNRYLDAAEAEVAGNPRLLARARHARQGLDRLICRRHRALRHHIPGQEMAVPVRSLGVEASSQRLFTDWPAWIRPYPDAEKLIKSALDGLGGNPKSDKLLPAPDRFKTRRYYDFYTGELSSHGGNERIVDDPESPVERAMRSDADKSHYFKLPFAGGVYDGTLKKSLGGGQVAKPEGPGYHWYRICQTTLTPDAYLWLTRAWTTQLKIANYLLDLEGREFEIWVSVKFTGPMFQPDAQGDSFIWIDRVILVEP